MKGVNRPWATLTRQDLRGVRRELVDMVLAAQEHGGAVTKFTKKHHVMLKFPDGQITSMSSTPSDHRCKLNVRRDLLRICPALEEHI